jgi:hypothetical protein
MIEPSIPAILETKVIRRLVTRRCLSGRKAKNRVVRRMAVAADDLRRFRGRRPKERGRGALYHYLIAIDRLSYSYSVT